MNSQTSERLREAFQFIFDAEREIAAVGKEIGELHASGFVKPFSRKNDKTGFIELGAGIDAEFPFKLRRNIKRVLEDLRSPLDHLVAISLGADVDVKHTPSFPISEDEAHWQKSIQALRKKGVPDYAIDVFERASGYAAGNMVLVDLNWLVNKAKHVRLTGLGSHSPGVKLKNVYIKSAAHFAVRAPNWDETKRETVVIEMGEGDEIDASMRIYISPVLSNSRVFSKEPVERALNSYRETVLEVLRDFEASISKQD